MKNRPLIRSGSAWLELLLAVAILALALQLFPSLWTGILWALDVRNWPRTVWFVTNLVTLLTLVAIRFGPQVYKGWRDQGERRASEQAKRQKQLELRDQRKLLERIKESQRRRMY